MGASGETVDTADGQPEPTDHHDRLPGPFSQDQWISILSPIGFLILWELTVYVGLVPATWFPAPTTISVTFYELVEEGILYEHTLVTLRRLLGAFLLASIPGIVLGLTMGLSKTIRAISDPIISIIYPIPKIALLPLIIIIFGFGDPSIIVTASITAFFVITLNTMSGVLEIDDVLLEAAENYHATGPKKFYKVVLPGSMPLIFTGLRLGLGLALIVVVAAEFIAAEEGLGWLIVNSWQILRVERMYCGFIAIGVIGWVTTFGLESLGDRLMPWQDTGDRL